MQINLNESFQIYKLKVQRVLLQVS